MGEDIIWEAPPPEALQAAVKGRYKDFSAALRSRPGDWAVLPGERKTPASAQNVAQNIRRGTMTTFPKGEFEAVAHGTKAYVRFIGKQAQTPTVPSQPQEDDGPQPDAGWETHRVRLWAQANGHEVAERGRLPRSVIDAYEAAHTPEQAAG